MGLIIFNDFKERDEMILCLRVIVCGSGDGAVIKLHHKFQSMVIPMVCGMEVWFERERRTGFCFCLFYFILDLILCASIVCECLYSSFKMLTCHYLIGGINSWLYAKTGPNVNSYVNPVATRRNSIARGG